MKILLINHGETEISNGSLFQGNDVKLSLRGVRQSRELVDAIKKKYDIKLIITSPTLRAYETSTILSEGLGVPFISSNALRAHKRPSEVVGQLKSDPKIIDIYKKIYSNASNPSWHYSDEENYFDFIERTRKFISQIIDSFDEDILVVTHGSQIKAIIGVIETNFNLTPGTLLEYWDRIDINYCSMTTLNCTSEGIFVEGTNKMVIKTVVPANVNMITLL